MANANIAAAIKVAYPEIDWDLFEDIDRALNWELWHGPLPANYWTEVEPLDHYEWKGYVQAEKDIREVLDDLPHRLYYDSDAEFVTEMNPEDDPSNWVYTCKFCDQTLYWQDGNIYVDITDGDCCSGNDDLENENEPHVPSDYAEWIGDSWGEIDPRKELMHVESWKQVF